MGYALLILRLVLVPTITGLLILGLLSSVR
jgi:hypothetical protein